MSSPVEGADGDAGSCERRDYHSGPKLGFLLYTRVCHPQCSWYWGPSSFCVMGTILCTVRYWVASLASTCQVAGTPFTAVVTIEDVSKHGQGVPSAAGIMTLEVWLSSFFSHYPQVRLKIVTIMYVYVYCKMCKLYRICKAKRSPVSLFFQKWPLLTIWGVHSRLFTCVHLFIFYKNAVMLYKYSLACFLKMALLKYNSHIIQFPLLKCTVQWYLLDSQSCATVGTI